MSYKDDCVITLNIKAVEKINFVLEDHNKLISMLGVADVIKHSLYKDIVTVRKILENKSEAQEKKEMT